MARPEWACMVFLLFLSLGVCSAGRVTVVDNDKPEKFVLGGHIGWNPGFIGGIIEGALGHKSPQTTPTPPPSPDETSIAGATDEGYGGGRGGGYGSGHVGGISGGGGGSFGNGGGGGWGGGGEIGIGTLYCTPINCRGNNCGGVRLYYENSNDPTMAGSNGQKQSMNHEEEDKHSMDTLAASEPMDTRDAGIRPPPYMDPLSPPLSVAAAPPSTAAPASNIRPPLFMDPPSQPSNVAAEPEPVDPLEKELSVVPKLSP